MWGKVGVSGNGKFIIVRYERFVEASGVTLKICLGRGKEDGINECINYRLEWSNIDVLQ